MPDSTELYTEFMNFRSKLIRDIHAISVFHETRGEEIVRPIGIIKTNAQYRSFIKKIDKWHSYVEQLCAIDPLRYIPTARVFHPAPEIILGANGGSYTIGNATSSKLVEKTRVVKLMQKHIETIKRKINLLSNSTRQRDNDEFTKLGRQLIDLSLELDAMLADNEVHYRLRKTGSTETICLYTVGDSPIQHKKRVPMAGVLFYTPGGLQITPGTKQKPRIDAYEFMGVKPIKCSLSNYSGDLFRESELIKWKEEHAKLIADMDN